MKCKKCRYNIPFFIWLVNDGYCDDCKWFIKLKEGLNKIK